MKKYWQLVFIILMIGVLVGLFVSSSMTYHQQEMKPGFIHKYFPFMEAWVGHWNIYYGGRWHNAQMDNGVAGMTQFVMRKMVHFGSFFLLGLFSSLGLYKLFRSWGGPLLIWLGTIFVAFCDEFHQMLTGDRTPSIHDVMLDSSGALLAILICMVAYVVICWIKIYFIKQESN